MNLGKMIVINAQDCIGCRLCELICSFHHEGIFEPSAARIRVKLLLKEGFSTPLVCLQCKKPLCMTVCEAKAIHRNEETGAIQIDLGKCTGCKRCITACPYGGMGYHARSDNAIVCDLCGGDPQCVKYCFSKAMEWVDIKDASLVRGRAYIEAIKAAGVKSGD